MQFVVTESMIAHSHFETSIAMPQVFFLEVSWVAFDLAWTGGTQVLHLMKKGTSDVSFFPS